MSKLSKHQQGFSAVETVLVLVIIVLIGLVGWFVYNNHRKSTTSNLATPQPANQLFLQITRLLQLKPIHMPVGKATPFNMKS